MNNNFGGVIWTNHALQRLKERGISQSDALAAFNRPQNSKHSAAKGGWVFYRNWSGCQIEVAATQNEKKEWLILSVWSKPSQTWSKEVFPSKPKNLQPQFLENLVEKVLQKLLGGFKKNEN